MKKSIIALLMFAAVFFLAACAVEPEGITLSATQISLEVGETFTVTAEVTPEDAEFDGLEWASANTNIVTVNSTGVLTAVGAGTTSVTVAAGEEVSGFIQVTVTAEEVEPEPEPEPEEEDPAAVAVSSDATDITVPYGTAVEDVVALLPATAVVEDEDGTEYDVDLRWVVLNYSATASPEEPEEYIASATFRLPDGVRLGTLVTKIDVFVTVQPRLARLALDAINEDPEAATLEDYLEAGIEGVTALNLSELTAVLADAKGDVAFPDWSYADVQGVVDATLPSLLGTVYDVPAPDLVWDMTLEMDGTDLVSVEVRSGDLYARFLAADINDLLLAFLEDNAGLLNNQRVSFEFTLETATTDKELIRMTYLELTRNDASETLEIPNSLLFNDLIIDGMGYDLNTLVVEADDLVVRNLELIDLFVDGAARNLKLASVEVSGVYINVASELTINDVTVNNFISTIAKLNLIGPVQISNGDTLSVSTDEENPISNLTIVLLNPTGDTDPSGTLSIGLTHIENLVLPANVDIRVDELAIINGLVMAGSVIALNDNLTLKGLVELNGTTVVDNSGNLILDGSQVFDGDLLGAIIVLVNSEDNEIHNSTVTGIYAESDLVMANPLFVDYYYLQSAYSATITLIGGTVDGGLYVEAYDESTIIFTSPLTVTNGGLEIDSADDAEIMGLEYLGLELDGDLVVGSDDLVVSGLDNAYTSDALSFSWQAATGAAATFSEVATGSAFTLTDAVDGMVIRVVVESIGSGELLTLGAIGPVNSNAYYVTSSSVTITEEATASLSNNITLSAVLKTEDGYDLVLGDNYDLYVSGTAITLDVPNIPLAEGGVLEFAAAVTEAGLYEDLEVYVRKTTSPTPAAWDLLGLLEFEVVASTPVSIEALEVTNLLEDSGEVGKGTTLSVELLVTDVFGNPVEGYVPTASITGVGLEAETALSAVVATDAEGKTSVSLDVADNQVRDFILLVSGSTITYSDLDNELLIPVSSVNAGNSSASMASTVTAAAAGSENLEVVFTLKDAEETGLEITEGDLTVRLVDADGTIIATATAISYTSGSPTGSAMFAIQKADEYVVDVHVEAYPNTGIFVPVQTGVELEVIAAEFDEIKFSDDLEDPTVLEQGESATITFTTVDEFGNIVPNITITYSGVNANAVAGTGFSTDGSVTTGTITTDENGEGSLVVKAAAGQPTLADAIVITMESAIADVEIDVDVVEVVDTADSSAILDGTTGSAVVSDNLDVVVSLQNTSGSAMANGSYDVYIELADGTTMSAVVALVNGTGTATFSLTEAAVYEDIKVYAETLVGSDEFVLVDTLADFTVLAGPLSTNAFEVGPELATLEQVTRGGVYEIKLVTEDAEGNPLDDITGTAVLALLSGFQADGTGLSLTPTGSVSDELDLVTEDGEAVFYLIIDPSETFSLLGDDDKYELTLTENDGADDVYEFEVNPIVPEPVA